jgi:hypothetical protein
MVLLTFLPILIPFAIASPLIWESGGLTEELLNTDDPNQYQSTADSLAADSPFVFQPTIDSLQGDQSIALFPTDAPVTSEPHCRYGGRKPVCSTGAYNSVTRTVRPSYRCKLSLAVKLSGANEQP